jgi:hypothetical protein
MLEYEQDPVQTSSRFLSIPYALLAEFIADGPQMQPTS